MSKLTLDETIKHCLEVAEKNECKMTSDDGCTDVSMKQCATDHRQLAEWLTELKQWHRVYGICPSYEMCIPECREGYNAQIAEYKRLLKAAIKDFADMDFHIYECDGMCDTCPLYGERDNCLGWRYVDETKRLLNDEKNKQRRIGETSPIFTIKPVYANG